MEEFNAAGRELYMLLAHLNDYEEGGLDREVWANVGEAATAYYARQAARVEIINEHGDLERVHFWIPSFCLLLSEETKDDLLNTVDRRTPGRQVREFFDKQDEFYQDLKHQGWLDTFSAWRLLISQKSLATNNQVNHRRSRT